LASTSPMAVCSLVRLYVYRNMLIFTEVNCISRSK
jgi:hypothetical protein